MCATGTPSWTLTVKNHRASVHAFAEILSSRVPLGVEARGGVELPLGASNPSAP